MDASSKRHAEEIVVLRRNAIAELERQGYDVRGKTPGQIRKMLARRRRVKMPKLGA